MNINIIAFFLICNFFIVTLGFSKDLTKQIPIEKTVFLKGTLGEGHFFSPNQIKFFTGKLYKLKIVNISDSKHYFSSEKFSKAIFTRKIQIKKDADKIAEIKGVISEVEVWPKQELEWWFVPIKTGYFNDLQCKVKDSKVNLRHYEMGMIGTIIIE